MIKSLIFSLLLSVSTAVFANSNVELELDGTQRLDSWTSNRAMLLEGVASDNKTYRVRLSCITKENNRAQGFAVGEIHVYKGTSHIGSKATFDFEQCTSLVEKMKNYAARLNLKWDLAGYNAMSTGKVTFEVTEL